MLCFCLKGSESVDSSSPRVVPLEQLLAPHPPAAASLDASQIADQLAKCESRIQHLTSLLSDAEGDAARLQQLNQVHKYICSLIVSGIGKPF